MTMYAIVKTGGKQYRVQQDETLLIERLRVEDGATVTLQPLLLVDGADVVDGDDLAEVTVQARVIAHERGPKLRIVKFKPKRGYKRRNGHRQELTRIQVTSMGRASGGGQSATPVAAPAPAPASAPAPVRFEPENEEAGDGA
jgi:large subunit ribosomal protein L21